MHLYRIYIHDSARGDLSRYVMADSFDTSVQLVLEEFPLYAGFPVTVEDLGEPLRWREPAKVLEPAVAQPTAAQIRKSVQPDKLISFEDGKGYKTLKRHLTIRGLTPAEYRAKWGLPVGYPMVSPEYSERRSQLARDNGLGRK